MSYIGGSLERQSAYGLIQGGVARSLFTQVGDIDPGMFIRTQDNIQAVILELRIAEGDCVDLMVDTMNRGFSEAVKVIKKDYWVRKGEVAPNAPSVRTRKGGRPVLTMSGRLDESINSMYYTVTRSASVITGQIHWNVPVSERDGFTYPFFHLTGGRNTPVRDFLSRPIRLGAEVIGYYVATGLDRTVSLLNTSAKSGEQFKFIDTLQIENIKDERIFPDYDATIEFTPKTRDIVGAGGVILPPNKGYAYVGAYGDVSTYIAGNFTDKIFMAWIFGLIRGKLGLTKRVQKRKLRHKIYEKTERRNQAKQRKSDKMTKVSYYGDR